MSFYEFDNRYMLSVMSDASPGKYSGVAIIDDQRSDVAQRMRELHKQGVRGFRLYTDKVKAEGWANSDGVKSMWATAADTGQAMCLLANPDALPAVERMIEKYPKTRVVIDHFARIGMTGQIVDADLANLCKLSRFPNVFVKTSAFYALGKKKPPYTDLSPMVMQLVKAFGSDRLMWASDCPYQVQGEHSYAASIDLIRKSIPELTAVDKANILGKTAMKVFFA